MTEKRKRSNYKVTLKCAYCGKEKIVNPCRANKSRFCNNECRIEFYKGKPKSDEVKLKISQAKGGIKKEIRTCVGCGLEFEIEKWRKNKYCSRVCAGSNIGKLSHEPWNKGLDPNDPRAIAKSEKQSKTIKKRYDSGEIKSWNKGLTSETDGRVQRSYEVRSENWWNKTDEEQQKTKDILAKAQVKAHSEGKYPFTFTKPEVMTWEYLESKGFTVKQFRDKSPDDPPNTWYHQFNFFDTFTPDFGCPDLKAVIEANGCYVHGHDRSKCLMKYGDSEFTANNQKRDRKKHWFYHSKGWQWVLVWECEAKNGDFHRIDKYIL